MEAEPVEHSRPPGYPTRREVLAGAMSFALVNVTGCSFVYAEGPEGTISVAPILEHGKGRGATGCVVISPPVFLSEEEALQVVKEELAKHGVQLARGPVLKELTIAPRCMQEVEKDETDERPVQDDERAAPRRLGGLDESDLKTVQDTARAAPLRFTGMDEKRSIAVEVICRQNYKKLGGVDPHNYDVMDRDGKSRGGVMATVREYNFKDAAQYVATEIRRQDGAQQRLYVGVFYDPVGRVALERRTDPFETREDPRSARDVATTDSKQLLRQQAQDFAAWLKQQGAI